MIATTNRYALVAGVILATTVARGLAHELKDPIKTDAGPISGATATDVGLAPVQIYKGIPYAAPPVGNLRWKAPQPVTPWTATRECTTFGRLSPQSYPTGSTYGNAGENDISEDCLYLNVLTAAKSSHDNLPVIIWFHGGGLTSGTGTMPTTNSAVLARQGAVVVTVNHRLGPIGYMAHPLLSKESEQKVSGNYGSLDLIAALRWVQKNIEAFGGNPKLVTIVGDSGGGQKVLFCMASPLATGLFHRAIVMSGGIGCTPLAQTEQEGVKLAAALGVSSEADALAALRAKPWQAIVKAGNDRGAGFSTRFTNDGWSNKGVAAVNDVPLIVGFTGGEKTANSPSFVGRSITPAISNVSKKYTYLFTHVPYGWGSQGVTAYHGIDPAYAFGTIDEVPRHFGGLFRNGDAQRIGADPGMGWRDQWVTEMMMKSFLQFAKTGDPNLAEADLKQLGQKWVWPEFKDEKYLDISFPPQVKTGWSQVLQTKPRY